MREGLISESVAEEIKLNIELAAKGKLTKNFRKNFNTEAGKMSEISGLVLEKIENAVVLMYIDVRFCSLKLSSQGNYRLK